MRLRSCSRLEVVQRPESTYYQGQNCLVEEDLAYIESSFLTVCGPAELSEWESKIGDKMREEISILQLAGSHIITRVNNPYPVVCDVW